MPKDKRSLDAMAAEIFELYQLVAVYRSRASSGAEDLSETEYVALDILVREGPRTIGEVQKQIGVAPAQMSRIVRALEERRGRGYVACAINPHDRRCVDISVTKTGRDAHARFRDARLGSMIEVLKVLPPDDRVQFLRILAQIRSAFAERLRAAPSES